MAAPLPGSPVSGKTGSASAATPPDAAPLRTLLGGLRGVSPVGLDVTRAIIQASQPSQPHATRSAPTGRTPTATARSATLPCDADALFTALQYVRGEHAADALYTLVRVWPQLAHARRGAEELDVLPLHAALRYLDAAHGRAAGGVSNVPNDSPPPPARVRGLNVDGGGRARIGGFDDDGEVLPQPGDEHDGSDNDNDSENENENENGGHQGEESDSASTSDSEDEREREEDAAAAAAEANAALGGMMDRALAIQGTAHAHAAGHHNSAELGAAAVNALDDPGAAAAAAAPRGSVGANVIPATPHRPQTRSTKHSRRRRRAPQLRLHSWEVVRVVNAVLAAYPAAARIPDGRGRLPLHLALRHVGRGRACDAIVARLLRAWPGAAACPDGGTPSGFLPLHLAAARLRGRAGERIARRLVLVYPAALHYAAEAGRFLPLHCATRYPRGKGAEAVALYLLRAWPGAATQTNHEGWTPLHLALMHHAGAAADRLVAALLRAAPSLASRAVEDGDGWLPLHLAAQEQSGPHAASVLQRLLDAHPAAAAVAEKDGWSPLHVAVQNQTGPYAPDAVRLLLRAHSAAAGLAEHQGYYPLHIAARSQGLCSGAAIVQMLLEARPDLAGAATTQGGLTPLHLATGFFEGTAVAAVAAALVAAHPAACTARDCDAWTPLHFAARRAHALPLVRVLLAAAPVAARLATDAGWLPLSISVEHQQGAEALEVVRALLDAYPAAALTTNSDGWTATHLAACHQRGPCSLGVLALLLRTAPTTVHMRTHKNWLPLHVCTEHQHDDLALPAVRMLTDASPQAARQPNSDGWLPLHLCVGHQRGAEAAEVAAHLAGLFPEGLRHTTNRGSTPLHIAAQNQRGPHAVNVLRLLVEREPAAAAAVNHEGDLPLDLVLVNAGQQGGEQDTRNLREAVLLLACAYPDGAVRALDLRRVPPSLVAAVRECLGKRTPLRFLGDALAEAKWNVGHALRRELWQSVMAGIPASAARDPLTDGLIAFVDATLGAATSALPLETGAAAAAEAGVQQTGGCGAGALPLAPGAGGDRSTSRRAQGSHCGRQRETDAAGSVNAASCARAAPVAASPETRPGPRVVHICGRRDMHICTAFAGAMAAREAARAAPDSLRHDPRTTAAQRLALVAMQRHLLALGDHAHAFAAAVPVWLPLAPPPPDEIDCNGVLRVTAGRRASAVSAGAGALGLAARMQSVAAGASLSERMPLRMNLTVDMDADVAACLRRRGADGSIAAWLTAEAAAQEARLRFNPVAGYNPTNSRPKRPQVVLALAALGVVMPVTVAGGGIEAAAEEAAHTAAATAAEEEAAEAAATQRLRAAGGPPPTKRARVLAAPAGPLEGGRVATLYQRVKRDFTPAADLALPRAEGHVLAEEEEEAAAVSAAVTSGEMGYELLLLRDEGALLPLCVVEI